MKSEDKAEGIAEELENRELKYSASVKTLESYDEILEIWRILSTLYGIVIVC